MLVEVCANSVESALNAERAGADRIELCSELAVGGITPSYGLLKCIKEKCSLPVHVLIRPRSGDFTYSNAEFKVILEDIAVCRKLGVEGVVSGVLHADYTLDVARTAMLMEAAQGMKFTFHRAFDWVKDPEKTMETLADLKVDYVLTSGQGKSALEGLALLRDLKRLFPNVAIMPGSGINEENVRSFLEAGFEAVHLSGTKFRQTLTSPPHISMNSASFLNDDKLGFSNFETIKAVVDKVK
ncbi:MULTISPECIES: copper homeostasis protein CutC [Maribacter]|uniref:PF03932 family protein CutC n=1 Tax=Maribacter flavus TaxID=1658664 RepID=A0ABU7IGQ3_9FLAO|nr:MULTISPECIES: copper homeostasis protein CutC [Maribacter]MDC6404708.1 copper homeostasis protein CutC [Maribacter sp. PR66]MEE1972122.1 copper homeostasis protein CutC [Maribacter flavus]